MVAAAAVLFGADAQPTEDFNQSLTRAIYARISLATRIHSLASQATGRGRLSYLQFELLSVESGPVERLSLATLADLATPPSTSVLNVIPEEWSAQIPAGTERWLSIAASWVPAHPLPVNFKQTYSEMCKVNPNFHRFERYVRLRLRATLGDETATYTVTYLFARPDSRMLQIQPFDYFISNSDLILNIVNKSIDPEPVIRAYQIEEPFDLRSGMFAPPGGCAVLLAAKEVCCLPGTLVCGLTQYRP
jgi:hypothetical protein